MTLAGDCEEKKMNDQHALLEMVARHWRRLAVYWHLHCGYIYKFLETSEEAARLAFSEKVECV